MNTWCALDAIGIPAALAVDARALTQCPTCGHELSVELRGGEPQPLTEMVLWYPHGRCGHLIDDFCSGANLFCSLDHLERWLGDQPPAGRVMTIAEVAEVGREVWDEASDQLRTDADEVLEPPGLCAAPRSLRAVTFEATVRSAAPESPTGQVSFRDGPRILGLSDLGADGTARLNTTLDYGSHAITAIYRGDDTFGPSLAILNHIVPGVASGADDDGGPPVWEVDAPGEPLP